MILSSKRKMQPPQADAHAIASFRRFYTLLPRSDDAALLILKLHLLIEEQIRAFVDERLQHKSALVQARLDCHQAICLAESLCTEDIHPNVWKAARKLNRLRNDVAHSLEPSAGVRDRMAHVCTLMGLSNDTPQGTELRAQKLTPFDNFSFAVSLLHTKLSVCVKRKPAEILRLVQDGGDV